MPELPEVEVVRAGLYRHVLGRTITRVDVLHPRPVRRDPRGPEGFALATDLAELLVRKGVPFREAHEAVGHLVVYCQVNDKDFADLTGEELAKVSPHFTSAPAAGVDGTDLPGVREVLSVPGALAARKAYGGTAPDRVREQLAALVLSQGGYGVGGFAPDLAARPRRTSGTQVAADVTPFGDLLRGHSGTD